MTFPIKSSGRPSPTTIYIVEEFSSNTQVTTTVLDPSDQGPKTPCTSCGTETTTSPVTTIVTTRDPSTQSPGPLTYVTEGIRTPVVGVTRPDRQRTSNPVVHSNPRSQCRHDDPVRPQYRNVEKYTHTILLSSRVLHLHVLQTRGPVPREVVTETKVLTWYRVVVTRLSLCHTQGSDFVISTQPRYVEGFDRVPDFLNTSRGHQS